MSDLRFSVTSDSTQAQRDLANLDKSVRNIEKVTNDASQSFSRLSTTISVAAATVPILMMGKAAIKTASDFETMEARLLTVTGSMDKTTSAFASVQRQAAQGPYGIKELTKTYADLAATGADALKSQRQIETAMLAISNAVAAVGGGDLELRSVTTGLSRMATEGRVTAERLNQLTEAGIPLTRVANKLGISMSQLRMEAEKGSFAFDEFYSAFLNVANAADGFGGAAERQVKTLKGAIANFGDALDILSDETFRKSGITGAMANIVSNLTERLIKMSSGVGVILRTALNHIEHFKFKFASAFFYIQSRIEPVVNTVLAFLKKMNLSSINVDPLLRVFDKVKLPDLNIDKFYDTISRGLSGIAAVVSPVKSLLDSLWEGLTTAEWDNFASKVVNIATRLRDMVSVQLEALKKLFSDFKPDWFAAIPQLLGKTFGMQIDLNGSALDKNNKALNGLTNGLLASSLDAGEANSMAKYYKDKANPDRAEEIVITNGSPIMGSQQTVTQFNPVWDKLIEGIIIALNSLKAPLTALITSSPIGKFSPILAGFTIPLATAALKILKLRSPSSYMSNNVVEQTNSNNAVANTQYKAKPLFEGGVFNVTDINLIDLWRAAMGKVSEGIEYLIRAFQGFAGKFDMSKLFTGDFNPFKGADMSVLNFDAVSEGVHGAVSKGFLGITKEDILPIFDLFVVLLPAVFSSAFRSLYAKALMVKLAVDFQWVLDTAAIKKTSEALGASIGRTTARLLQFSGGDGFQSMINQRIRLLAGFGNRINAEIAKVTKLNKLFMMGDSSQDKALAQARELERQRDAALKGFTGKKPDGTVQILDPVAYNKTLEQYSKLIKAQFDLYNTPGKSTAFGLVTAFTVLGAAVAVVTGNIGNTAKAIYELSKQFLGSSILSNLMFGEGGFKGFVANQDEAFSKAKKSIEDLSKTQASYDRVAAMAADKNLNMQERRAAQQKMVEQRDRLATAKIAEKEAVAAVGGAAIVGSRILQQYRTAVLSTVAGIAGILGTVGGMLGGVLLGNLLIDVAGIKGEFSMLGVQLASAMVGAFVGSASLVYLSKAIAPMFMTIIPAIGATFLGGLIGLNLSEKLISALGIDKQSLTAKFIEYGSVAAFAFLGAFLAVGAGKIIMASLTRGIGYGAGVAVAMTFGAITKGILSALTTGAVWLTIRGAMLSAIFPSVGAIMTRVAMMMAAVAGGITLGTAGIIAAAVAIGAGLLYLLLGDEKGAAGKARKWLSGITDEFISWSSALPGRMLDAISDGVSRVFASMADSITSFGRKYADALVIILGGVLGGIPGLLIGTAAVVLLNVWGGKQEWIDKVGELFGEAGMKIPDLAAEMGRKFRDGFFSGASGIGDWLHENLVPEVFKKPWDPSKVKLYGDTSVSDALGTNDPKRKWEPSKVKLFGDTTIADFFGAGTAKNTVNQQDKTTARIVGAAASTPNLTEEMYKRNPNGFGWSQRTNETEEDRIARLIEEQNRRLAVASPQDKGGFFSNAMGKLNGMVGPLLGKMDTNTTAMNNITEQLQNNLATVTNDSKGKATYDDILESPNFKKMAAMVMVMEGTAKYDDPFATKFGGKQLDDLSDHPRTAEYFNDKNGKSTATTAAGAFQFLRGTWDEQAKRLQLPDFSAKSQMKAFAGMLEQAGVLGDVVSGKLDEAMAKVGNLWAGLPSSTHKATQGSRSIEEWVSAKGSSFVTNFSGLYEDITAANPRLKTALDAMVDTVSGVPLAFKSIMHTGTNFGNRYAGSSMTPLLDKDGGDIVQWMGTMLTNMQPAVKKALTFGDVAANSNSIKPDASLLDSLLGKIGANTTGVNFGNIEFDELERLTNLGGSVEKLMNDMVEAASKGRSTVSLSNSIGASMKLLNMELSKFKTTADDASKRPLFRGAAEFGVKASADMIESLSSSLSSLLKGKTTFKEFGMSLLDKITGSVVDSFVQSLVLGFAKASGLEKQSQDFFAGLFNMGGKSGTAVGEATKGGGSLFSGIGNWLSNIGGGSNLGGFKLGMDKNPLGEGLGSALDDAWGPLEEGMDGTFASFNYNLDDTMNNKFLSGFGSIGGGIISGIGNLLSSLLSSLGGGGGGGSLFGSLLSLGASLFSLGAPVAGGSSLYSLGSGGSGLGLKPYSSGGFTGNIGTKDVAGVVHGGEFVINANATRKIGLSYLNKLNTLPGYSEGGFVGGAAAVVDRSASMSMEGASRNSGTQVVNVNITGDISRQTRSEIYKMLPSIADGVNAQNREKGYKS